MVRIFITRFLPISSQTGQEEGHWEVQEGQGPSQQVGRQSQEEEVVQGKSEGQAQQPGALRQGHLRQTVQGGAQLQAHHPGRCLGEAEDPRVAG
uniref:Uncharacterized protein n=1 Tax=Tetraodon nigroviridis TaxID=99883 RepID=H3D2E3_TETNG